MDLAQRFCGIHLPIPVLASAMDAVVDPAFAGALAGLGGLAVLNLEGVQARYEDPGEVLARIAAVPDAEVHEVLATAYAAPIRDELVARRIEEIHAAGSKAAVASAARWLHRRRACRRCGQQRQRECARNDQSNEHEKRQ